MNKLDKYLHVIAYVVIGALAFIVGTFHTIMAQASRPTEVPCVQQSDPKVYTMQFGVRVNKFLVVNDRLHLIIPMPVTGESGAIIEIEGTARKAKK